MIKGLTAVATVLLLALLGLGACSGADDIGVVVRADGAKVVGAKHTITTPAGTFTLRVGDPVDRVDDDNTDKTMTAPSGRTFVPVSWHFEPLPVDHLQTTFVAAHYEPTTISVTNHDESVELGAPYDVVGPGIDNFDDRVYYAAVTEPLDDLRIDVTYDGLTQVLDPSTGKLAAGPAAIYGKADEPTDVPCPRRGWAGQADVRVDMECTITRSAVPYLPDAGWAPKGHIWTVLHINTTPKVLAWDSGTGLIRYRPRMPIDDTVLDGREPEKRLVRNGDPVTGRLDVTLVFNTGVNAAGRLTLRRGFDVAPVDKDSVIGLDAPRQSVVFEHPVPMPSLRAPR